MTFFYTDEVATCRGLGNFGKLLFRWKGSIYKVLWAEIIVYLVCFYTLNVFYHVYLTRPENCDKKRSFIQLITYCENHGKDIPMGFVLGFYVGIIVNRWWTQWMELPWPDTTHILVATLVNGNDEKGRQLRRTIMRYTNLCFVLCVSRMSVAGKERFPTLKDIVDEGFMTEEEQEIIENITKSNGFKAPIHWIPLVWDRTLEHDGTFRAGMVVKRARKENRIKDDISANTIMVSLMKFRHGCQNMLNYDWVNVPLAYTQVVTLAVYLYFLASLMSNQLTIIKSSEEQPIDFHFPFFAFIEFFFYMGWLKVAEIFINPYGMDDDDFEISWMINRFFEVAYIVVDDMHQEHPNLLKDQYWDAVVPLELPYTEQAAKEKAAEVNEQIGSAKDYNVPIEKQEFVISSSNADSASTLVRAGSTDDKRNQAPRFSKRITYGKAERTSKDYHDAKSIASNHQKLSVGEDKEYRKDVEALMEQEDVAYVPSKHNLSDVKISETGEDVAKDAE